MFGNIDLEKRVKKANSDFKTYEDLDDGTGNPTYFEWKYSYFWRITQNEEIGPAKVLENNWLWDKGDMQYDPVNRAMVVMPLILHEVELGCLSEEMEGELFGTKEDLEDGLLDSLLDEEIESLKEDLDYCFNKLEKEGKLNG